MNYSPATIDANTLEGIAIDAAVTAAFWLCHGENPTDHVDGVEFLTNEGWVKDPDLEAEIKAAYEAGLKAVAPLREIEDWGLLSSVTQMLEQWLDE